MSADLIGDDACREAFNKARQQRFSVYGLDVVCEPDIFRSGYAAGRDSEIAKRDARMAEFEKELQAGATAVENCELFRAELAAIKAREPVAIEFRQFMTSVVTGAGLLSCGKQSKGLAAELSATAYKYLLGEPVYEAKAQGVVMHEQDGSDAQKSFWAGFEAAKIGPAHWNIRAAWNEFKSSEQFKRLNAAPVQQVSVPDERIIPTSAELIQWAWEEEPEETRFQEGYNAAKRWVKMQIEAGIAAPAAPAADASDVLDQAMYTLISIGYHENSGLVHELRQALAAHSAKGVV